MHWETLRTSFSLSAMAKEAFMICPRCASEQSDELKFCKSCGANLEAVRYVLDNREIPAGFDWSKTWVADMFLSQAEQKRRKRQLEMQMGITPAEKRRTEIKAGVITAAAGSGVAILLYFLMQGIILSGRANGAEQILSRIWIAGVIPIFVGLALIINGVFVSRKQGDSSEGLDTDSSALASGPTRRTLGVGDVDPTGPATFSVTEGTTKHLDKLDSNDRVS
jgi:hypothetical protein